VNCAIALASRSRHVQFPARSLEPSLTDGCLDMELCRIDRRELFTYLKMMCRSLSARRCTRHSLLAKRLIENSFRAFHSRARSLPKPRSDDYASHFIIAHVAQI
jgi:hypothetical protein